MSSETLAPDPVKIIADIGKGLTKFDEYVLMFDKIISIIVPTLTVFKNRFNSSLTYTELEEMIKRYKTDLDSTIIEPKQYSQLPNPGLRLTNTESTLSLPLNNESSAALKSFQCNTVNFTSYYWISDEQLEIQNGSFATLVERDIKREVVRGFCNNFNEKEFNIRLLGVRFCDSSSLIGQDGEASTNPVVLQPFSLDVASQRDDFEDFCATVCIQVFFSSLFINNIIIHYYLSVL